MVVYLVWAKLISPERHRLWQRSPPVSSTTRQGRPRIASWLVYTHLTHCHELLPLRVSGLSTYGGAALSCLALMIAVDSGRRLSQDNLSVAERTALDL